MAARCEKDHQVPIRPHLPGRSVPSTVAALGPRGRLAGKKRHHKHYHFQLPSISICQASCIFTRTASDIAVPDSSQCSLSRCILAICFRHPISFWKHGSTPQTHSDEVAILRLSRKGYVWLNNTRSRVQGRAVGSPKKHPDVDDDFLMMAIMATSSVLLRKRT